MGLGLRMLLDQWGNELICGTYKGSRRAIIHCYTGKMELHDEGWNYCDN